MSEGEARARSARHSRRRRTPLKNDCLQVSLFRMPQLQTLPWSLLPSPLNEVMVRL
jgi:hypothetical protein